MLRPLIVAALAGFVLLNSADAEDGVIRVMSFNLWHGGDRGGQPLETSAEVIRKSGADLVGLQETRGESEDDPRPDNAARLARILGWHYADQGEGTGIVSRFPIAVLTPKKWGVRIDLPDGRRVHHFNVHFSHAPYQPYQLLGIPYADAPFLKTAEEAITAAKETHGAEVGGLLEELRPVRASGDLIFVTGDFNEPSHLDWTAEAAKAQRCPIPVAWPTTQAVSAAGLIDAFRTVRPDPVADPAWTWTPTTMPTDPKDKHDRIDFVFTSAPPADVLSAQVVGESPATSDLVIENYPSDHRAVVAAVKLRK